MKGVGGRIGRLGIDLAGDYIMAMLAGKSKKVVNGAFQKPVQNFGGNWPDGWGIAPWTCRENVRYTLSYGRNIRGC